MPDFSSGGSPGTFGGGLGDFLGGFNEETGNIRTRNADEAARKDARDTKVFEALANSDDPDIRAAAVTGLITGNHPAKGMDKWFGKVGDHPAYQSIKSLVADQHREPFMDPAKRHSVELTNDIEAKIGTVRHSGLPADQQNRAIGGIYGAPPPRPLPLQAGTVHLKNGTTVAGFFDPGEGAFYDQNYQAVPDAVKFSRGNDSQSITGDSEKVEPDPKSSTGYSNVRRDRSGKEYFRVEAPAPGTGTTGGQPYEFIQTPGGLITGNKKTGSVANAKGGAGVVKAEPPSQDLSALRSIAADILRLHPEPKPLFPGGTVSPEKIQQWRAAVDAEVPNYKIEGVNSYADLQAKVGGARAGVEAATPPPAVPPTLGAKKPPKKAEAAGGKIDVAAVLKRARELRAGAAGAPPTSAPPR